MAGNSSGRSSAGASPRRALLGDSAWSLRDDASTSPPAAVAKRAPSVPGVLELGALMELVVEAAEPGAVVEDEEVREPLNSSARILASAEGRTALLGLPEKQTNVNALLRICARSQSSDSVAAAACCIGNLAADLDGRNLILDGEMVQPALARLLSLLVKAKGNGARYAALAVATLAGSKEGVDTILRCRIIAWEKALLGLMTDQDEPALRCNATLAVAVLTANELGARRIIACPAIEQWLYLTCNLLGDAHEATAIHAASCISNIAANDSGCLILLSHPEQCLSPILECIAGGVYASSEQFEQQSRSVPLVIRTSPIRAIGFAALAVGNLTTREAGYVTLSEHRLWTEAVAGVAALLSLVKLNRRAHQSTLRHALVCVSCICRYRPCLQMIFHNELLSPQLLFGCMTSVKDCTLPGLRTLASFLICNPFRAAIEEDPQLMRDACRSLLHALSMLKSDDIGKAAVNAFDLLWSIRGAPDSFMRELTSPNADEHHRLRVEHTIQRLVVLATKGSRSLLVVVAKLFDMDAQLFSAVLQSPSSCKSLAARVCELACLVSSPRGTDTAREDRAVLAAAVKLVCNYTDTDSGCAYILTDKNAVSAVIALCTALEVAIERNEPTSGFCDRCSRVASNCVLLIHSGTSVKCCIGATCLEAMLQSTHASAFAIEHLCSAPLRDDCDVGVVTLLRRTCSSGGVVSEQASFDAFRSVLMCLASHLPVLCAQICGHGVTVQALQSIALLRRQVGGTWTRPLLDASDSSSLYKVCIEVATAVAAICTAAAAASKVGAGHDSTLQRVLRSSLAGAGGREIQEGMDSLAELSLSSGPEGLAATLAFTSIMDRCENDVYDCTKHRMSALLAHWGVILQNPEAVDRGWRAAACKACKTLAVCGGQGALCTCSMAIKGLSVACTDANREVATPALAAVVAAARWGGQHVPGLSKAIGKDGIYSIATGSDNGDAEASEALAILCCREDARDVVVSLGGRVPELACAAVAAALRRSPSGYSRRNYTIALWGLVSAGGAKCGSALIKGQSFPKETLLAITAEVQSGQAEDKDFVVSAARLVQLLQPDTIGGQSVSQIIL